MHEKLIVHLLSIFSPCYYRYVDPQVILRRKKEKKESQLKRRTYSIVDGFATAA